MQDHITVNHPQILDNDGGYNYYPYIKNVTPLPGNFADVGLHITEDRIVIVSRSEISDTVTTD